MNEKIKRFSFGAENIMSGQGRNARIATPELAIMSIEDRKIGNRTKRMLIVSIHARVYKKTGWMKEDNIELSIEGDEMMDAVLHPAVTGYKMQPSGTKVTSRMRIFIPVPVDYERFADLKAPVECTEVECVDGKIAFKMPW